MIGEYQRMAVVTIKHSCGHEVEHKINRQPGFSQLTNDMSKSPCEACCAEVSKKECSA